MKDILITSARLKKEIRLLVGCFIAAFLINATAIIIYKTPWYEIFSQLGYVVAITLCIYLLIAFFRIIIVLIKRIFTKNRS